ncbi:MAG: hypothetical protein V3S76_03305 [Candidatus Bipolaricaulota bacterium]
MKQGFPSTIKNLSDVFRKTFLHKRLTILSVSLVNGRFKAMSIINDSIHQSWERPGVIRKPEALRQAIADAIHHTHYTGTHIAVLVEDQRSMPLTLQLPVMPLTDLLPILERKAQQAKTWEGPAAWRYHLGIQARGKQSIHLEIWPQGLIDDMTQICEDLGLHLQQLASLSALLESQLSTLPVDPGEATILISMVEGKVMFVAGGEDGTPFFIRHLAPVQDWVPLGERIGTEVNRTIMFIVQQLNLPIPHIWFLGEEERLTLGEIQPHVSTSLLPCPINPDWKYWLWVVATLPINLANNFTPSHVLRAPLRNMLTHTVAASIAGLLIFGVGTAGMIEGYFAKNRDSIQAVNNQAQSFQQEQQDWKGRLVALHNKQQWAQAINASVPSLEGPFLSYLGTVLAPQTILHKVSLKRTKTHWDVELTGNISTNLSESFLLLEQLAGQLADGPYHMIVHKDWRKQLLTQAATSSTQEAAGLRFRFTMKGTIS